MQVDVKYVFFELWNVRQADVRNQKNLKVCTLSCTVRFFKFW